ncbi:MAG: lipoprotein [Nitrospira sp.]|nr:lipoprotein [Nitrospira sp.]
MDSQRSVSTTTTDAHRWRLTLLAPMALGSVACTFAALAVIGSLAACGQKGPLTLPKAAAAAPGAAAPASAVSR